MEREKIEIIPVMRFDLRRGYFVIDPTCQEPREATLWIVNIINSGLVLGYNSVVGHFVVGFASSKESEDYSQRVGIVKKPEYRPDSGSSKIAEPVEIAAYFDPNNNQKLVGVGFTKLLLSNK